MAHILQTRGRRRPEAKPPPTLGETAQLVAGIGDGWTPQMATVLHKRSDGHPLFLAEMARQLKEAARGGAAAGADVAALLRLPYGVRQIIASRLSQLSAEGVRVLSNAAVIGRRFGLDLLKLLLDVATAAAAADAL